MNHLIEWARQHCIRKPGMTRRSAGDDDFGVLEGYLDTFARFYVDEHPPVLMIRCSDDLRGQLEGNLSGIHVSERMRWETEGWTWTDVALDGSVPREVVGKLINHSYDLLCDQFDDAQLHRIAMLQCGLCPRGVFEQLVEFYGFRDQSDEIESLARPTFLLGTTGGLHDEPTPGETRIGGEPDLPDAVEWPTHRDGKPLAFLAQINLADLADEDEDEDEDEDDRGGLPDRGVLSFFSAWGWQAEDSSDPDVPPGDPSPDWTRVLYHDDPKTLRRRPTPPGVNAFPPAIATIFSTLSLPNDRREPAAAGLDWDDETWERFSQLTNDFNLTCGQALHFPPRHLLLGFADYIQDFVDEVAERDLTLLFQLASDDEAQMCWGDGGNLYFWINPRDLARKDFSKVHTDYQCG